MATSRNQRRAARLKKRVKVEYGTQEIDRLGYSKDISVGGLFLNTAKLLRIGEKVHMRVSWPAGLFYIEGIVARVIAAHPDLRAVQETGMGIRFIPPEELVDMVVPHTLRANAEAFVEYRSEDELKRVLDEQIRHDIIIVPVREPRPPLDMVVDLKILLAYKRTHNIIPVRGRVIQLSTKDFEAYGNQPYAVIRIEPGSDLISRLTALES